MNGKTGKLDTWVIEKIEKEYKDDIGLLIGHNAYRLEEDRDKASFSYFFPITDRGRELARTFIIDGVGYDLFPMSWERIGRMASFDEDNASVIADAEILYARTDDDRRQFEEVQDRLQRHLNDHRYMVYKALEKLDIAMGLYQEMLFEDALYRVREKAGFIMMYLANVVSYSNQTFFTGSSFARVEDLASLPDLPNDFIRLFTGIPMADSVATLRESCFTLIRTTRDYLREKKESVRQPAAEPDYNDLADWYQELSYEWRQIAVWGSQGDALKTFIRSSFLQNEIDVVAEGFGLGTVDLLGQFNAGDLKSYLEHAAKLEQQLVSTIEDNSATLDVYASIDEFIGKNR